MSSRMPHRDAVREAAAAILADPPPLAGWAAGGDQAVPRADWVRHLRRVGWPVRAAEALLPQHEHRGPRAGQRTADAAQPVTVVPASWLRLLAERLGVEWAEACRWTL